MQNNTPSSRRMIALQKMWIDYRSSLPKLVKSHRHMDPVPIEVSKQQVEWEDRHFSELLAYLCMEFGDEELNSMRQALLKDSKTAKKQKVGFGEQKWLLKHKSGMYAVNKNCLLSRDGASKSSSSTITDMQKDEMELKLDDEFVMQRGDTALHMAVRINDYILCYMLVKGGADVNCLNGKCMTPIMLAAKIGCEKVLSLLVQHPGARLNIGDQNKDTALHLALKYSNVKAAQILLEAGAYIKALNNDQFTPFHLAAIYGQDRILEMCLDKYGGSLVDLQKDDKFTALHLAALNNQTACLRLLIKHKADLNIRNNMMQTALHIAVSQKYMDCVKILVKNKAKLDLSDEDRNTALHNVIRLQNIHQMKKMIGKFELEDMFRFTGSPQRGSDKPKDIAIYLVEQGASLDTPNNDGKSPLTLCQDKSFRKKLRKIQSESCTGRETPSLVPESALTGESTAQLQITIQNLQDEILCTICHENRANIAFNCGHRACDVCEINIHDCHMCRARIETRIRIY